MAIATFFSPPSGYESWTAYRVATQPWVPVSGLTFKTALRFGGSPAMRHAESGVVSRVRYVSGPSASHGRTWTQLRFIDDDLAGQPVPGYGWQKTQRPFANTPLGYVLASPGLLGLAVGITIPLLPVTLGWRLGAAAVIGAAGYISPEGTWLRRFSIGAGIGAAGVSAYHLWQMGWEKVLKESVKAAGRFAFGQLGGGGATGIAQAAYLNSLPIAAP